MSKYTIKDVGHIIPQDLTAEQIKGVEDYLNNGTIPPFDPCIDCNPSFVRKLISLIQIAERNGLFPPKREVEAEYVTTYELLEDNSGEDVEERGILLGGIDDPDVDFTEVIKDN